MTNNSIAKSALLMLIIVVVAVAGYEVYLRNHGANIAYDDGPALWADKRGEVYGPRDKAVVFIGSSRIKYDLDIPTWKDKTGLDAVQLSIVGSNPRPMLEDLANDPDFKGRLIIDVTEPLFFSDLPPYSKSPNENIKYFHDRTPAQQASFKINEMLESQLVFLDKDNYSLNAQLDALELKSRPGVFSMPVFPMDFNRIEFNRQSYMTPHFVADTTLINRVRGVWAQLFSGPKPPPMTDAQIMAVIGSVKKCTDKIKARGGEVVFVRTPSSGPFKQGETMMYPKEKFWNRILATTGCPGIHYEDYPVTAALVCPEFSHLCRDDAKKFTQQLVSILAEKGWKFSRNNKTI